MPPVTHELEGELATVESPPAKIKAGTATIAGLGVGAAALVPILVDFLKDGTVSASLKTTLIVAGAALVGLVILIRGAQAVAIELTRGRRAPLEPIAAGPDAQVVGLEDELAKLREYANGLELERKAALEVGANLLDVRGLTAEALEAVLNNDVGTYVNAGATEVPAAIDELRRRAASDSFDADDATAALERLGLGVDLGDEGPRDSDGQDDGDAVIDHGDPDDHDEVIVAGGGPDDERDLHDRSDVPPDAGIDLEGGPRA